MRKTCRWTLHVLLCLLSFLILGGINSASADYDPIEITGIPKFGQRASYTIPTDINPRNISVNVLIDGQRKDCGIDCISMVEGYFKDYGDEDDRVYHAVIAAHNQSYGRNIDWANIIEDPDKTYPGVDIQPFPIPGYIEKESMSNEEIYSQLSEGNPVLIHRKSPEHWVVIYGYDGPSAYLDLNSFMIMSPHVPYTDSRGVHHDAGVFDDQHLSDLIPQVYDHYMYRTTGLSNLKPAKTAPDSAKYSIVGQAAEYNGHYYAIYSGPVTWEEAKNHCESLGGYLATITSQDEQEFINGLNSEDRDLWIGGYCENDTWKWVTGEEWSYTNWSEGEPNNSDEIMGNEACIVVWPNKWNDLSPDNTYQNSGFICEYDGSSTQPDPSGGNTGNKPGVIVARGTCGTETTWTLDNNGTLTVTGIGKISGFSCDTDLVESVIINENVTSIDEYAFSRFTNLTGVSIPSSVENIKDHAFYGCSKLESVSIPKGVKNIESWAFSGCTGMECIILPDSLQSVSSSAFSGCRNVNEAICAPDTLSIGAALNNTGSSNINGIIRVGSSGLRTRGTSSSTEVGQTFKDCTALKTVTIEEGVTSIGDYAFAGCDELQSVTLPSTLTDISDYAFYCCNGVEEIICSPNTPSLAGSLNFYGSDGIHAIIRSDAEEMGQTFRGSKVLESVTIQNGVTSIGSYAFAECENLKSIDFPSTIENIDNYAYRNCNSLSTMFIPSTVTRVGDYAFAYCDGLTKVTVPSTVQEWGTYVFSSCSGLTDITIHDGVTVIGEYMFSSCQGIESIVFPTSVNTIGTEAFAYCNNLKDVSFSPDVPDMTISFYGCSDIHVTIRGEEKEIRDRAFTDNSTWLTELDIEDGVTGIGAYAFYGTRVKNVIIPSSVKNIYYCAFPGLDEISLSPDVPRFNTDQHYFAKHIIIRGEAQNIRDNAFSLVYSSTKVTIEYGVTGIGDYCFSGCSGLSDIIIPASVTYIGKGAFYNCTGLTDVILPTKLKTIETYAFTGCTALSSIVIPSSVEIVERMAFYLCSGLQNLTIQSGVGTIGDHAFYKCTGLSNIELQNGVSQIASGAFRDCSSLQQITIPSSIIKVEDATFSGCTKLGSVVLPEGLESIGDTAFYECSLLTDINLPSTLINIGSGAFTSCENLISIQIPSGVKTLGSYSFEDCYALKNVLLQEGLQNIEEYAFWNCSIERIEIPSTVERIGSNVFKGCTGLNSVVMHEGLTNIGAYAFSNCNNLSNLSLPTTLTEIGKGAFSQCNNLSEMSIPVGVTILDDSLFYRCGNLKSVSLPEGLQSIKDSAFYECQSLTTISMPTSVTEIGNYAFYNCMLLNPIVLPEALISIGNYAFHGCSSISEIHFPSDLTTIGDGAFINCNSIQGSIEIPSSVTSVSSNAFTGCDGISDIYYGISSQQWGNMGYPLTGTWTLHVLAEVHFIVTNGPEQPSVMAWTNELLDQPDLPFEYGFVINGWYSDWSCDESTAWDFENDLIPQYTSILLLYGTRMERTISVQSSPFHLPTATKTIEENAFEGSPMTIVYIPEGCLSISTGAFKNCPNLQQVRIPGNTTIAPDAFAGCQSLFLIAPTGSPAEEYCQTHKNCMFIKMN